MFRPDITDMIDWALKKQLPTYLHVHAGAVRAFAAISVLLLPGTDTFPGHFAQQPAISVQSTAFVNVFK